MERRFLDGGLAFAAKARAALDNTEVVAALAAAGAGWREAGHVHDGTDGTLALAIDDDAVGVDGVRDPASYPAFALARRLGWAPGPRPKSASVEAIVAATAAAVPPSALAPTGNAATDVAEARLAAAFFPSRRANANAG